MYFILFALVNIKVRDCICDSKCLFENFRLKRSFEIDKMALTKILNFFYLCFQLSAYFVK